MRLKDKVYLLYHNVYYEAEFLDYREAVVHCGYKNCYYRFKTRAGHLSVTKRDYNTQLQIFNNQLDCLITLGIQKHQLSNTRAGVQSYRRLPFNIDKITQIAKKFKPEEFI